MAEKSTIKTIEIDGYKLDVDIDAFDDVRFFELADEENTRASVVIDMLKMGIGEDGYQKMYDYFVKKEGRLRVSTIRKAFDILFGLMSPKASASGQSENDTQTN